MDGDERRDTYFFMTKNEIKEGKLKVEFQGFQKTCGHNVLEAELRNGLRKVGVFVWPLRY